MPMPSAEVEKERIFYVLSKLLNNAILGVPQTWLTEQMRLADVTFACDLDDCHICLTGIAREQYLCTAESEITYFASEYRIKRYLAEMMGMAGYRFEFFYHGQTKEQCVIFSPVGSHAPRLTPAQVAQAIHEVITDEMTRTMPSTLGHCCNFTVLSPHIDRYEQLRDAHCALRTLKSYAFFHMQPVVFSPALLKQLRRPFTLTQADNMVEEIQHKLQDREQQEAFALLETLFLEKLKASFSMELVRDTCVAIKVMLLRLLEIYSLTPEESTIDALSPGAHCSIEALYAATARLVAHCLMLIGDQRAPLSELTRAAIRYVRGHADQSISLSSVAVYLHVSDAHLSRTMKKDLNKPFSGYLADLRMEIAAKALRQTDMKINEITRRAGFSDTVYFHRVFKKAYGMTPQQFRSTVHRSDKW